MPDNIKCLLEVGDRVRILDLWGPKLGGKKGIVTSLRRFHNCESGFLISTDITDMELDANWFEKINDMKPLF